MVGGCYDILRVDPQDLTALSAKFDNAFEYGDMEELLDQPASKPEVMDYRAAYGGGSNKTVSELSSSYDFQTLLKQEGSIEVGDATGALFSATLSGSFESLHQETKDQGSMLTYVSERVSRYRLGLNNQTMANGLTTSLDSGLRALPTSRDDRVYQAFIERFGTHYMAEALFGGRATQRVSVSKEDYVSLAQEGVDVRTQASLTLELVKTKEAVGRKDSRDQRFTRSQSLSVSNVVYVGGYSQEYLDMWAMSVPDEPMPIAGRFEPLSSLLCSDYFLDLDAAELRTRQRLLRKATDAYLASQGVDVSVTRLRYGDVVSLSLATSDPARGLSPSAGDFVRTARLGDMQSESSDGWSLVDPNAPDSTEAVEYGRPLALRSTAATAFLDGRAGADGSDYLRGEGLVGLNSDLAGSAQWTVEVASGVERSAAVDGDLVTLRSQVEDRRGRRGLLLAETAPDDCRQRVYSFGSDRQRGTVWSLCTLRPRTIPSAR